MHVLRKKAITSVNVTQQNIDFSCKYPVRRIVEKIFTN